MSVLVSSSVQIQNAQGLHVRPAVMLSKLVKQFDAEVLVSKSEHGPWIRANSSALLMRMKLRKGEWLYIRTNGDESERAAEAISSFLAETD